MSSIQIYSFKVKTSNPSKIPSAKAYHLTTMPYPSTHDVMLKKRNFCPSWEMFLASDGWAMSSKSSSIPSKFDISHPT
jgi:hypothetical protein